MAENVSFIQGNKEQYNPSEMQGGLFFSKDSKEILLNGESYGKSDYQEFQILENFQLFPKLPSGDYLITVYTDTTRNVQIISGDITINLSSSQQGSTQTIEITDEFNSGNPYVSCPDPVRFRIFNIKQGIQLKVYNSFGELKQDTQILPGQICLVKGYYRPYDGGDALWVIEPNSQSYNLYPAEYNTICPFSSREEFNLLNAPVGRYIYVVDGMEYYFDFDKDLWINSLGEDTNYQEWATIE